MYINGIEFPRQLVEAIENNTLVVFVGAGGSMGSPTNLPNFDKLTEIIAEGTGMHRNEGESCEAFLGRIKHKDIDVNRIAADTMSGMNLECNDLHETIIDLFDEYSNIKIVTTNYDKMFEQVLEKRDCKSVKVYSSPALPLGNDINGIVHIHGIVDEPKYMILTDEDFGQAYLADGYVSRFLIKLFETYTILFVGYSYNDVIVRYLTRAMTKGQQAKRYVLTDNNAGTWGELGIEPIYYEKGNHDNANHALHNLGVRLKRGLLDWKNRFKQISELPPKDLTLESELEFCLMDSNKVFIFAESVHGKNWLKWLESKGVFDKLFLSNMALNEIDRTWAIWLCKEFLLNEKEEIKKLLAKHNNIINPEFADIITRNLYKYREEIFASDFNEYIVLIDEHLCNPHDLYNMTEIALDKKLTCLGWNLFTKLFKYQIKASEKILSLAEDSFEYKWEIDASEHLIEHLWEDYGELFIESNARVVAEFCKRYIEEIHCKFVQLKSGVAEVEPYDFWDVSIEDESQIYSNQRPLYVLSCAMSKSILLLEATEPEYVNLYISSCVKSGSTLLRRIGLKMMRDNGKYSADNKITLLLETVSLFSIPEKEQIFKLVAEVFDVVSKEHKDKVINLISGGPGYDDETTNAYSKFNWCVWLDKKCGYNESIQKIIDEVKSDYPYFEPRPHPELSSFMSTGSWSGSISPLSEEELMRLDDDKVVELLKDYKEDNWEGPSRGGLLNTFANCVKKDFVWTNKILDKLLDDFECDQDVWDYLFRGLAKSDYSIKEHISILNKITVDELVKERDYEIADYIKYILKQDECKQHFKNYKGNLFGIQIKLWKEGEKKQIYETERIIDKCCNCVIGTLTENFIVMLSYEKSEHIPDEYKKVFDELLNVETRYKDQVICTLVGQLAFLFSKDREWSKAHLIPFLTKEDTVEFAAAWEGICWYSTVLYQELADEMQEIYLAAVDRIGEMGRDVRARFVDLYTVLIVYVVDDPVKEYIPRLFNVADDEDRDNFACSILGCLDNMDSLQKTHLWKAWLRKYWIKRTLNVPKELNDKELTYMLQWLFKLEDDFENAVEIVIEGPVTKVDGYFWYSIRENDIIKKFPKAATKLVVFLLESCDEVGFYEREVKELYHELVALNPEDREPFRNALLKKQIEVD